MNPVLFNILMFLAIFNLISTIVYDEIISKDKELNQNALGIFIFIIILMISSSMITQSLYLLIF